MTSGTADEKTPDGAEVRAHPNRFAPPALYAFATRLFASGAKDDAEFWFYAAQLRARCDTRLWHDEDAGAVVDALNQKYGVDIIGYAFTDVAKLGDTLETVEKWDATTPHDYDRRWPALEAKEPGALAAMLPGQLWDASDKQTRQRYLQEFRRATGGDADSYFADPKLVVLANAARRGDVAEIDHLIAEGAKVNEAGKDGTTVLWFPFRGYNKKGFQALLDHGADPTVPLGRWRDTVLAAAASRNDPDYLAALLGHGVSPNALLPNSVPLIFSALVPGALPSLRVLIARHARLEVRDPAGNTPLLAAAAVNQYEAVGALIAAGADFRATNKQGQDLAYFLYNGSMNAERRQRRAEVVATLVAKGVKLAVLPDDADHPEIRTFADAAKLSRFAGK